MEKIFFIVGIVCLLVCGALIVIMAKAWLQAQQRIEGAENIFRIRIQNLEGYLSEVLNKGAKEDTVQALADLIRSLDEENHPNKRIIYDDVQFPNDDKILSK